MVVSSGDFDDGLEQQRGEKMEREREREPRLFFNTKPPFNGMDPIKNEA